MSNSYTVQPAPAGLLGFDADSKLSADRAIAFYHTGYRFCIRYLSRLDEESDSDLTRDEVMDILESGLALMAIQHVSQPGWLPSAALGGGYGEYAAAHARALGLLPYVNIWLDLEGINSAATDEAVIEYCQSWYQAVTEAGYTPGLYVGAGSILDGSALYADLPFQHFWRSESQVPDVDQRGYQLVQKRYGEPVNGINIDQDVTQEDELGNSVLWMIKA